MKLPDRAPAEAPQDAPAAVLQEPAAGTGSDRSGSDGPRSANGSVDDAGDAIPGTSGTTSDKLLKSVEEIVASASSLIEVYSDRIRLSLRRKLTRVVLVTGAVICTAVWLSAAALASLRGICGAFTALFDGRAWLGDLTGGLVAVALGAGGVGLYLQLSSRRELVRMKSKYQRMRNETR